MKNSGELQIKEGDILVREYQHYLDGMCPQYCSFYTVTRITESGKTVYLRELKKEKVGVEERNFASIVPLSTYYQVIPGADFIGEIFMRRINDIRSENSFYTNFFTLFNEGTSLEKKYTYRVLLEKYDITKRYYVTQL